MNLSVPVTDVNQFIQIVDDETASLILKILTYGVTPVISALGITGNLFSIAILKRHGLHKCSNILLISLAFADLCFLIGFNNVPKILYDLNGGGRFIYSRYVSLFLFVVHIIFFLVDYTMGISTLSIPMIIAIERLVAVFLPLKFNSIITPRRTWVAVIIVIFYNFSYMFYSCFWFKFKYIFDYELNRTVGIIARSDLFYRDQHAIATLEEIYFSIKVQPMFTLVGCILIIVKVKIASRKRIKMTSNNTNAKASTSKTTQTLLAVCLVYIFVCIVLALPTYLPESYMSYSMTSDKPSNLGVIMYQAINIVVCTNSSWNFIIYIALNKNFRDTFQEIIGKCRCKSPPKF